MLYEWRDAKMLLILDALRIDHVKRFKSLQKNSQIAFYLNHRIE